jgi:uncharacterized protein YndB with AHSA1/START domain
MRHTVRMNVGEPQDRVAALFCDPDNLPQWWRDVERCVPLQGVAGEPGSSYRLVPRDGRPDLVATVVARRLPSEVRLRLEGPASTVAVTVTFVALPGDRTLLVSEEVHAFRTAQDRLRAWLARPGRAHRRRLRAFKAFAESRL